MVRIPCLRLDVVNLRPYVVSDVAAGEPQSGKVGLDP